MENKRFIPLIKNSICKNWELSALSDYNDDPTYRYKDVAREIVKLHMLFDAMELQKGDKVAICGRNSSHWAIAFFASMTYGAVPTTILHDFSGENIQNIVNHSDAKVFFVAEQVWSKIDAIKMPFVETIFLLEDFSILKANSPRLIEVRSEWDIAFAEKYPNGLKPEDIIFYEEQPDDVVTLNYTSGTTSMPKGVMLPSRSLWSNIQLTFDRLPFIKPGDSIVSMLPMAHMYGLTIEILMGFCMGCHIHFLPRIPSPNVILEAFSKYNPIVVIAVPLIIEKIIQGKVFPELKKQPAKTLMKIPFTRKKVLKKIADKLIPMFGNHLYQVIIGGAALNKEVGRFLTEIKFPYTVGYGMTECGPLISYVSKEHYKPESCGQSLDRMEMRVDSEDPTTIEGELHVKGDHVMIGYYKNKELTDSVLSADGWLNTGDLVTIDSDDFVFIKGRSKSLILGPSGQNIYPEEIEDLLNSSPYISEVLVIEENKKLIALIYPDADYLAAHNLVKDKNINAHFASEIKAINKQLPEFSKISNFRLRNEEFEKTPKRSIKRFLYQK